MRRVVSKRPHGLRRGAYPLNGRRISAIPATRSSSSCVISTAADRSIYLRHFSTRMHTVTSPSNAMLSPFVAEDRKVSIKGKHDIEVDEAFMKLLKAMSVLKSSPAEPQMLDSRDAHDESQSSNVDKSKPIDRIVNSEEKIIACKKEETSDSHQNSNAESRAAPKKKRNRSINQQVQEAMFSKRTNIVIDILNESMISSRGLNDNMLTRTIHYLSYNHQRESFEGLKYLVQRCKDQGKLVSLDIYRRVIEGIGHSNMKPYDLRDLGNEIYLHIRESFSDRNTVIYQHVLLPTLVCQMAMYSDLRINQCAKPIVEYMIAEDFPFLDPELYELILKQATRHKVGHLYLPFHELLTELVSRGYKPQPSTVHSLLQNYYPYVHDPDATYAILSAIKTLAMDSASETNSSLSDYKIDIGTLESITMTTKRCTELHTLVWDLVELFEYQPTVSMFEDVVLSFGRINRDECASKALLDMENNGYVPSYALMKQYALQLSSYHKKLVHLQHLLSFDKDRQYLSSSAMNCLLLGFGMRKDLDSAFEVFEDFTKLNLTHDENTFAFLMESLWLSVKDQVAPGDDDIDDVLAIAETIIGSMQLAGVERGSRFIYDHIRLLCLLKKFDDAKLILEEAIMDRIPIKTGNIIMIATGYLDRGDVESAREVAKLTKAAGCGETPWFLLNRIGKSARTLELEKAAPVIT